MNVTTISIKPSTKKIMEKAKKIYERRLNKAMSWDEFLLLLLSSQKTINEFKSMDVLELSDEEAELLKRLLERGRESWRERVLTQVS